MKKLYLVLGAGVFCAKESFSTVSIVGGATSTAALFAAKKVEDKAIEFLKENMQPLPKVSKIDVSVRKIFAFEEF